MEIHVPTGQVGGTFAVGADIQSGAEIVTLDFIVDTEPGVYTVVQRIRLAPSALEPLYLELGAMIGRRREAEGDAGRTS